MRSFELRFRLHTNVSETTKAKWNVIQERYKTSYHVDSLQKWSMQLNASYIGRHQERSVLKRVEGGIGNDDSQRYGQIINVTKIQETPNFDYHEIVFRTQAPLKSTRSNYWKFSTLIKMAEVFKEVLITFLDDERCVEFFLCVVPGFDVEESSSESSSDENSDSSETEDFFFAKVGF